MSTGKIFEKEISQALQALSKDNGLHYHNSNNPKPICDHLVWVKPFFYLFEEKEIRSDRFPFSRISPEERKHLNGVARNGGYSWILIKRVFPGSARAWGCSWAQWLKIEANSGYVFGVEKQARGSASIDLRDELRPPALIELKRVTRTDSQGYSLGKCWDLNQICGVF